MSNNPDDAVAALEKRAEHTRGLLQYAPRAFVIEFAGTPKSGKSTAVEAIRHFFSRLGFRVHVLTERAAACPIPMKGHLFFNTWCATSMLAELLANVETATDIIIVDRGIFDALVWLTLQDKRNEVTADEARTIEAFLLLDRWRSLIDLAIVMSVSAEEALRRETGQRITSKPGSIMNPEVLAAISEAVHEALRRHGPRFAATIHHETSAQSVKASNLLLGGRVLDCLEQFLNPEILVVSRSTIERLPLQAGGAFGDEAVRAALQCVATNGQFMRRAEAERRNDYVQIIPCGVLTYADQVFVFQRKDTDPKYRLYGKTTIWEGTHVPKRGGVRTDELLQVTLSEKVTRSLFLSRLFPIATLGYCWDKEDPAGSRHFGIAHKITIDNPHTAVDLKRKEFKRQRGHSLIGEFVDRQELVAHQEDLSLEPWSKAILQGTRATQ